MPLKTTSRIKPEPLFLPAIRPLRLRSSDDVIPNVARVAVLAGISLSLPSVVRAEDLELCPEKPATYQGRRVSSVEVSSPIFFFSAAKYGLNRLAATLPLKTGDGFAVAKYGQAVSQITPAIPTAIPSPFTS